MLRRVYLPFVFMLLLCMVVRNGMAQQQPVDKSDTFFLAKKKGLWGKLGKSISLEPPGPAPVKVANPYLKFAGKVVRNVQLVSLGFDRNIYDTNEIRDNFGIRVANALHRNTRTRVIEKNLFLRKGDRIFPYLLADNEKFLRTLPYLQDARIIVTLDSTSKDSVDIIVLTKDVFSIGGSASIGNLQQGSGTVKEENLAGSGNQLLGRGLYDITRTPQIGYGAQFIQRNIQGSFIDWTTGFTTFNSALSGAGNEEFSASTSFDRPLVSAYFPWTGSLSLSYNRTNNFYVRPDSVYDSSFRYEYYYANAWIGYNFGSQKLLYKNLHIPVRKFIAIRGFDKHFNRVPDTASILNAYKYQNTAGILGAIDVFKQTIYRTNFIYGFGRNEDVPEGFNTSLIGGWTIRQGRKRPYYGIDLNLSRFTGIQSFYDATLRLGGYRLNNRFEDADILLNVDHFTRLKKLGSNWLHRDFFTFSTTKQINTVLNQPLLLQSTYGLPYFSNGQLAADFRATLNAQCVFYELKKYLGFRFAPFLFVNMSGITPIGMPVSQTDLYTMIGGGVRTRNENLIFGTVELKGFYYPRTIPGMSNWGVQLTTNLQFTFSSIYVRQPDFITDN